MRGSNEIRIDIENQHDPLGTLKRQAWETLSALSPSRCIYRVPKRLRQRRRNAYTPQVVSIGPLHHGDDEHFVAMEEHKKRYVHAFLHRHDVSWDSYIKKLKDQEDKLRSCYAEQLEIGSNEFVTLVLVDALFLIELLLRDTYEELQSENDDYIFGRPRKQDDLWSDLVMLENQLPFFILEYLWEGAVNREKNILFCAYSCFWNQIYSHEADSQTLRNLCDSGLEVNHFIDVIRNLCLPRRRKYPWKCKSIPSITQLRKVGVKFKVRSTHNLLDIDFANGFLEIPKLNISNPTEATIRNLVAYEQCHYIGEGYITQYVVLMDGLVNTPEDVELLRKYGILNNIGDSNQVSTLINNLGKGVIADYNNFYFAEICERLDVRCKKNWPKWKVNLRRNYLNTPWAVISVAAGIILLVLTLIQTICSIISIA